MVDFNVFFISLFFVLISDTDSDLDFQQHRRRGRRRGTSTKTVVEDVDEEDQDNSDDAGGHTRKTTKGCGQSPSEQRVLEKSVSPSRTSRRRRTSDYLVAHPSSKQLKVCEKYQNYLNLICMFKDIILKWQSRSR